MVATLLSVLREEELASIAGDPQAGPVGAPLWDDRRLQELRSLVLTLSDSLTARGGHPVAARREPVARRATSAGGAPRW